MRDNGRHSPCDAGRGEESRKRNAGGATLFSLTFLFAHCLATFAAELVPLSTFAIPDGGVGAAETVCWDQGTRALWATDARGAVHVIDVADPAAPRLRQRIEVGGKPNCVAVRSGLVAVAVAGEPITEPGEVAFYDTAGKALRRMTVGHLPDMVCFAKNGQWLFVANEGEAAGDIDPPGSVSGIDLRKGLSNAVERRTGFASLGAGLAGRSVRVGPGKQPVTDIEPEYIAVDSLGGVWVTLQEANAISYFSIAPSFKRENGRYVRENGQLVREDTLLLRNTLPLGAKDHSRTGAGLDPSDRDEAVRIEPQRVLGLYQPDALSVARIGGQFYLFTANEGDPRDEGKRVKDLELDPGVFPDAEALQADEALGRLEVSATDGDLDGDGDHDALYAFGARSFSIWNTRGQQVFDSGDEFERLVSAFDPAAFNADNEKEGPDDRSDKRGPEPEAITVGKVGDRHYAFIGLERCGGIMVYDVTEPQAATFVQYINDRERQRGPEDIEFVPAEQSPTGKPFIAVACEISGSVGIYEMRSP